MEGLAGIFFLDAYRIAEGKMITLLQVEFCVLLPSKSVYFQFVVFCCVKANQFTKHYFLAGVNSELRSINCYHNIEYCEV